MSFNIPLGPDGLPLANLGDPTYEGMRVFVVTLKDISDSDSLYNDMETLGGPLHIPNRVVECVERRPTQRNTDYMLSYNEAVELTKDSRVLAVELNPTDRGHRVVGHSWTSTDTFSKAFVTTVYGSTSNTLSWGLFRTRCKNNPPNWGNGGSDSLTSQTLISDSSGKNVDVVIIDGGLPYPTTLEYAQNADGTGYSRMVEHNWYQYRNTVTGNPNSIFSYSTHLNDHQAHTSGTVAGNSQGFARDSNIYNITYGEVDNSGNNVSIEYVKQFHINKPVNPLTGVKNPTVTNNSWGYAIGNLGNDDLNSIGISQSGFMAYCSQIVYRGTTYTPTSGSASSGTAVWNTTTVSNCKIPSQFGNGFPTQDAATDANFIDAAKSGVINVVSAGNSFFYEDIPTGPDYNNYLVWNYPSYSGVYYYNRGSSPGCAVDVASGNILTYAPICVGAMGAVVAGYMSSTTINTLYGYTGYGTTDLLSQDYKSEFSNYGPRVDVFAPGEAVLSVLGASSNHPYFNNGAGSSITDPRMALLAAGTGNYRTDNSANVLARDAGTSMAAPHVCGVLACILEKYPRMDQTQARAWISLTSQPTLASTSLGSNDATDAATNVSSPNYNGSSNKQILYLPGTRVYEAEIGGYYAAPYPINNTTYRNVIGPVWPRPATLNARNSKATFSLSASLASVSTGNTTTITLTTTNLAEGRLIPYIITARPRSSSSSVYSFNYTSINNAPLTGNLTISSGSATLPIVITTTDYLIMTVRLGIFPSPTVNITVN